jgi:DNA-directed RNA polymerase II subunit RPB2
LRRINTPIDKSGKLIDPRKLHGTSIGYLCPAETPEGQSVGVVKNLSYLTIVSGYSDSSPIYEYIRPYISTLEEGNLYDKVKVFLNGRWIGISHNPIELFYDLKSKKYKGIINIFTSIVFNYLHKEIVITNECGRLLRPLFKVKNNKLLITDKIIQSIKSNELNW